MGWVFLYTTDTSLRDTRDITILASVRLCSATLSVILCFARCSLQPDVDIRYLCCPTAGRSGYTSFGLCHRFFFQERVINPQSHPQPGRPGAALSQASTLRPIRHGKTCQGQTSQPAQLVGSLRHPSFTITTGCQPKV